MERSPGRQELIRQAAELGATFAPRAEKWDREASFPFANYDDLRNAGFLGLCIPESYGGLGADFVTYALVSEELGRHCGATALTFNMHTCTMLVCGEIADALTWTDSEWRFIEARRERLFSGVIEHGTLHAQPFSEGRGGGATAGVATKAVPVDGGYRVTGRKIFASLADAADIHNIHAVVDGEENVRFLGVPATAAGLTVEGEWDPLGMRGTVSRTLLLDDVFVPADNEWMPPGGFEQLARRWPWFYLTLSFTYLGICRAVLDLTGAYLRGEAGGPGGPGARRDHPVKQAGWAQMWLDYDRAQSLMYRVLDGIRVDPTADELRRAWSAMATVMETAPALASRAIQVCGGRSLLRPLPLERLYRDARCGATMLPWSVEVCLERLGRFDLYPKDPTEPPV
jgi:alkylation response protein AidB-like acyl-CoA dehydrogenase